MFGLTYVTKALSTQIKLNNVNQLLASNGLCSVVVKIPANNLNGNNLSENEQKTQKDISTVTYDFSDYNFQIETWPPANNINKRKFIGKALYVDNNAGVYIRDNEIERVAKEVNYRLDLKFKSFKTSLNDINWKVGQPCICKYHLDRRFYRAEIVQIEDHDTCKVRFVDYGNIEQVKMSELRSEIICGNIPMLINRYIIADMIPSEINCKWSRSTLDRIHTLLVGKVIDVVTVENDINKCHMTVNGASVIDLLISEGLVRRGDTSSIKKHDDLYDFNNQSILEDKSFATETSTIVSKTPQTNNDFLFGVPKRNYEEYEKFFFDKSSEDFKTKDKFVLEEENTNFFNFDLAFAVNTSIGNFFFLNFILRRASNFVSLKIHLIFCQKIHLPEKVQQKL